MEIRPYLNELVHLLERGRADALPESCRKAIAAVLDEEAKAGRYMTRVIHELKTLTEILLRAGRKVTATAVSQIVRSHPAVKSEVGRSSVDALHKRQEEHLREYSAKLGALAPGAVADPDAPTISLKDLLQAQLKRSR